TSTAPWLNHSCGSLKDFPLLNKLVMFFRHPALGNEYLSFAEAIASAKRSSSSRNCQTRI
ncbi:hypothetical protein J0895_13680, partial [Phormidium pseudopriestleyi FRX01]